MSEAKFQSTTVEEGFHDELAAIGRCQDTAKVVLRDARIRLIEQVFTLALRLPAGEAETGRNLVKPHLSNSARFD